MPYGPPIEHFEFLLQLLPCSVVKEEERTFNLSCLPTDGILEFVKGCKQSVMTRQLISYQQGRYSNPTSGLDELANQVHDNV